MLFLIKEDSKTKDTHIGTVNHRHTALFFVSKISYGFIMP